MIAKIASVGYIERGFVSLPESGAPGILPWTLCPDAARSAKIRAFIRTASEEAPIFDFLFRHSHKEDDAKGRAESSDDQAVGTPAIRRSVCTGEAVGGYLKDGRFHDTELLATDRDIDEFARKNRTDRTRIKIIYE